MNTTNLWDELPLDTQQTIYAVYGMTLYPEVSFESFDRLCRGKTLQELQNI